VKAKKQQKEITKRLKVAVSEEWKLQVGTP
jgi:hypothetical protein